MRVGCGSATIGMFAKQWFGKWTTLWWWTTTSRACFPRPGGKTSGRARNRNRDSGPPLYSRPLFSGWPSPAPAGRHDISDPLTILNRLNRNLPGRTFACSWSAPPASSLPITNSMKRCAPSKRSLPETLKESVGRIRENCEPALTTVLFMGGAGGSLRAGVTENPVKLTDPSNATYASHLWRSARIYLARCGITFMVDVTRMPENAFGYVPTPALVAPSSSR